MSSFAELKMEAIKIFGEVGGWVFDEWEKLNETFFYGKNIPGDIIWGLTPQGRSLGYYLVAENLICLHKILMRPRYPTNCRKWEIRHVNKRTARDVLLHEMIHQRIHQTGGWEGESSHNNERFVEEVNRIAKPLGLNIKAKVIKPKKVHNKTTWQPEPGCLSLKELSDFPYSSRSDNYYYRQS